MCTIHKRTATAQQQQQQNLIEKWKSTWIDFFKEYTNGQNVYEKKLNIIHHYGNENQKHIKLILHSIGYLLSEKEGKKRKITCLWECREIGLGGLLLGVKMMHLLWKTFLWLLRKLNIGSYELDILSWLYIERNWNQWLKHICRGSLVGCRLWGRTESDTAEATQQQQQQHANRNCYLYLHTFYF